MLQRSIYADLIDLHLGLPMTGLQRIEPRWFSAIRWIMADRPGRLAAIELPPEAPAPASAALRCSRRPGTRFVRR
jgi:hypothetical protein